MLLLCCESGACSFADSSMKSSGGSARGRYSCAFRVIAASVCVCVVIGCKERIDPGDPLNAAVIGSSKVVSLTPGVLMQFRWVPAGRVSRCMNSELNSSGVSPLKEIRIKEGFWMSSCEVPLGIWRRVMHPDIASRPDKWDFPVNSVSWWQCMDFISRLTKPGKQWSFDLPTDAQWEYACRAGSSAEFYGDPLQIGWLEGNSDGGSHPVGQLMPNAWGLCDMHGNVSEWCKDSVDGNSSEKIIRGGSWASDWHAQASVRNSDVPGLKFEQVGFRLVIRRDTP